jgi:hypothetical protein
MADNTPVSPGIRYPNDYSLKTLTILTAVTTFDVKSILVELSINEDIYNNTMSGYLMVVDASGFIESLQMNGNEFIRITLNKIANDSTNAIDRIFRIFKVAKRNPENDGNTETYSLYFCSEELLLSEQYKVNKSYKGKDITSNILDILNTYLKIPKNKVGVIENTYGVYDFIIPNLKPFDAINWMSNYARPAPGAIGSDMLFYENKFGFNFRSLQNLFKGVVYNNYSYNPKNYNLTNSYLGKDERLFNVMSYEIMDSFDTLGAINQGVFANRLLSVDPLLRRFKVTDFDYGSYSSAAKKLNNFPVTNNYKNRFGDALNQTPQALYKFVLSNYNQSDSEYIKANDSVQHDIMAETYIPNRTAQIPLLSYTRVKISVPGDVALTVGRIVNFSLLSKNPNNREPDDFYSGNYLITAVRHMVTLNEYKTVLELAKESTVRQYSAINNTSTLWQNTAKGEF